jgi:hypothetical protein
MAKSTTTWAPGTCGNPNGRPKKGMSMSDIFAMELPKREFARYVIRCALGRIKECPFATRAAAWSLIMNHVEGLPIRRSVRQDRLTVEVTYVDELKARDSGAVIDVTTAQLEPEEPK